MSCAEVWGQDSTEEVLLELIGLRTERNRYDELKANRSLGWIVEGVWIPIDEPY